MCFRGKTGRWSSQSRCQICRKRRCTETLHSTGDDDGDHYDGHGDDHSDGDQDGDWDGDGDNGHDDGDNHRAADKDGEDHGDGSNAHHGTTFNKCDSKLHLWPLPMYFTF